ncbi:MAG: nucleoside triphosphate pyrophosphohydrolase [Spirochaetota bacterium]
MQFKETRPLYQLEEIAEKLRSETGCPWDREQTPMSLRKYLIEESYEVIDAIESGKPEKVREELGDVLYQVYAHSQIAKEAGQFTVDDVAAEITAKLIRRHPHVFGSETILTGDAVADRWENIKKKEREGKESILDGVPAGLPALLKAYRVQEKTSRVGFDWNRITDVEEKLGEEIGEFREAIREADESKLFEEYGDILFTLVNIGRFLKIDPEDALQQSTKKFMTRFKYVEKEAAAQKKELKDMTLAEMDELWNEAKRNS